MGWDKISSTFFKYEVKAAYFASLLLLSFTSMISSPKADQVILLYYNDRPPYTYPDQNGHVIGIVAEKTEETFTRAGIPFRWELVPTNRLFAFLKENKLPICNPLLYRTADREAYLSFSKPFYRNQPSVAIARENFDEGENPTIQDIFTRKGLRVLVKPNFSYGAFLDDLFQQNKESLDTVSTTTENDSMLKMISENRADLMFAAEEEAKYLASLAPAPFNKVKIIRFPDMPQGAVRYIGCSKIVPTEVIERLNDAIPDVR